MWCGKGFGAWRPIPAQDPISVQNDVHTTPSLSGNHLWMGDTEVEEDKPGARPESDSDESEDDADTSQATASGWGDDRVVLPGGASEPIMIRRRTLMERATAADQLPHVLARRAARQ